MTWSYQVISLCMAVFSFIQVGSIRLFICNFKKFIFILISWFYLLDYRYCSSPAFRYNLWTQRQETTGRISVRVDFRLLSVSWDYLTEQMERLWQQIILGFWAGPLFWYALHFRCSVAIHQAIRYVRTDIVLLCLCPISVYTEGVW